MSGPSGFTLDRFQVEACAAIDAGHNVLVAAPTGSGKTVVAEHAIARALDEGRRAFYTTPIKALSNQKYADLCRRHGADRVGLLTGDNAINPDADAIVMTTEVLRNMIYASSPALDDLGWVVLDEVHYLQDTYRGPVWEEVIVHAPPSVRFVALSATVSNASELAEWIEAARGRTETVVEHERPVELINHYLVYDKASGDLLRVPTLVGGRPNPDGDRFDAPNTGSRPPRGPQKGMRRRYATPRRSEVVEHLADADLLPAICFIFSRAACDEAARAVLDAGTTLTTAEERARIGAIVSRHVAHLGQDDLAALGHDRWLAGLLAGAAAHHAGMVPPFKEAVEACFTAGLVKVVFATETLALGINMPARSVVIESLSKFTGETHEDLSPSQYTQLTGRAGRRGLDPVGHALVLWSPWNGFDKVAALAASREFVLRSAFRPTYNMVVNLVQRYERDQAHELLGRSFAQFQADRSLGRLGHRRATRQAQLVDAQTRAHCERGDVEAYREARAEARAARRQARTDRERLVTDAVDRLVPGDVVRLGDDRLAVLSTSYRRGTLRLRVIDTDGQVSVLDHEDFEHPPYRSASLSLPQPFDPRSRTAQDRVTTLLRKARLRQRPTDAETADARVADARTGGAEGAGEPASLDELGVAGCPDLGAHLAAAAERDRLQAKLADLDQRLAQQRGSLSREFDQLAALLEAWGFLDGWSLTERGAVLSRLFHETDLLCASVLCDGLLDGIEPAPLAGLVSLLTYEHRSKEPPPPPWYPSKEVRARASAIEKLAGRLATDETRAGLAATRLPDPSFLPLAHAWAAGESFDVVIADEDLSGGDFVRNIKTLIDLLRQIAKVAPVAETRANAGRAADALFRGIIAVSSEVGTDDAETDDERP